MGERGLNRRLAKSFINVKLRFLGLVSRTRPLGRAKFALQGLGLVTQQAAPTNGLEVPHPQFVTDLVTGLWTVYGSLYLTQVLQVVGHRQCFCVFILLVVLFWFCMSLYLSKFAQ